MSDFVHRDQWHEGHEVWNGYIDCIPVATWLQTSCLLESCELTTAGLRDVAVGLFNIHGRVLATDSPYLRCRAPKLLQAGFSDGSPMSCYEKAYDVGRDLSFDVVTP